MFKKKIILTIIILLLIGISSILVPNFIINQTTAEKLFSEVSDIPENKVGLLLGTSKYLQNGNINLYYQYRLEATVSLYQNGKIDYILISGDNGQKSYNEPETFKDDLIKSGIPADKIYLDYAGFRTLDSIVRAKEIFGQNKITIISQKFHNERAIYISENKDIEAVGFNAKDVTFRYGLKIQIRELLARTKMMIDLYVINEQPKFLGDKIQIR
ncbi:MAG: YdcF family protein [Bacteroidetes bacterium]|nr:YdcF family protein [Bacteroidota bacterium]MCB0845399.1 YdcF family protein [Bacteroidota bacterium]